MLTQRFHTTTLIFIGFFLLGLLIILWGVVLPDLSRDLTMSPAQSGWFFLTMAVGTVTGAYLGGKYVQKFDFLLLFAALALIEAVVLVLVSMVQQSWQLLLGIFGFGLFCSVMFTIGHTLIARLHADRRAKMMGLMDFMFSLGTLAAPFLVVAIYWSEADWRDSLRLLAASLLLLALYAYWLTKQHVEVPEPAFTGARHSLSYRAVLAQPAFVALAFAMFGYGAVEWGNGNWFVSYANSSLAIDTQRARLVFAFFTAGMVVSRLAFAWFIPLLGSRRLLQILAVLMLSGALAIKLLHGETALAVGNLLLGLGLGGIYPLLLSSAMDLDPDNGPVLSGLSNIAGSLGCQVVGLGTGLWAQGQGIGTAFWMVPMVAAWLCLSAFWFSRYVKTKAKTKAVVA